MAIALDGNYYKAFARRGAARFALQKYESALEGDVTVTTKRSRWPPSAYINQCSFVFGTDYETVLKLDPNNFEAQNEVKKIRQVNLSRVFVCVFVCLFSLFFFSLSFFCPRVVSDRWQSGVFRLKQIHTATAGTCARTAAATDQGAAEATGGSCPKRQSKPGLHCLSKGIQFEDLFRFFQNKYNTSE